MRKSIKIAITGTGGFLGSSTLEYFNQMPYVSEIRALYHSISPKPLPKENKVRIFYGDLSDPHTARDLVHGADVVFHFANKGFPTDADAPAAEYLRYNLTLTGTLLDAMVSEKVSRIIFASSGGGLYQYNPFRKVSYHEGSEIEFRSAYGLTKVSIENLLLFYKQVAGISPAILRISNPFGKWQVGERRQGFIGHLISRVQNNEGVNIFGGLETVKDFIYIADLLRVFDGFLQYPGCKGIYNVGSGVGVSLREVITNIERVSHKKVKLTIGPFLKTDCPWTVLNTSKLQKTINWTCRHSLADGIQLIWNQLNTDNLHLDVKEAA